jgi:hypothetical protein
MGGQKFRAVPRAGRGGDALRKVRLRHYARDRPQWALHRPRIKGSFREASRKEFRAFEQGALPYLAPTPPTPFKNPPHRATLLHVPARLLLLSTFAISSSPP